MHAETCHRSMPTLASCYMQLRCLAVNLLSVSWTVPQLPTDGAVTQGRGLVLVGGRDLVTVLAEAIGCCIAVRAGGRVARAAHWFFGMFYYYLQILMRVFCLILFWGVYCWQGGS